MDKIENILWLVNNNVFEVKPNGEIWRNATFSRTGKEIPINPQRADCVSSTGYRKVRFGQDSISAHHLIWLVFNGNIPAGMEINHKNGIKHDNNPSNLELVTRGGNIKHAYDHGLRKIPAGEDNPHLKVTDVIKDKIIEMRKSGKRIEIIANECGINRHTAGLVIKQYLPEMAGHLDRYKNLKKK